MNPTEKAKMLQAIAETLDEILEERLGERTGFCLLIFPFGTPDDPNQGQIAEYVSNGKRADMIRFLKETVERFENQEDIPPTIGTA